MLKNNREIFSSLVNVAENLSRKGLYHDAIREYKSILGLFPHEKKLYNTLGDLYQMLRDWDNASRYYASYARALEKNNYPLQAIAVYRKIIRINRKDPEIYSRLADLYNRQGFTAESVSLYQDLAAFYEKHQQTRNSISVYEKMNEIQPDNLELLENLADRYIAEGMNYKATEKYLKFAYSMTARNNLDDALEIFNKIFEIDPHNINAKKGILALFLQKGDYEKAEAEIIKAVDSDECEYILEGIDFQDAEKADRMFNRLVQYSPDNTVLLEKYAFILLKMTNSSKSEEYFKWIGEYYKSKGNLAMIIEIFSRAKGLKKEFLYPYRMLIDAYSMLKQEERKYKTMKELAFRLCESGEYSEAIAVFNEIRPGYLNDDESLSYLKTIPGKLKNTCLILNNRKGHPRDDRTAVNYSTLKDLNKQQHADMTQMDIMDAELPVYHDPEALDKMADEIYSYYNDIVKESENDALISDKLAMLEEMETVDIFSQPGKHAVYDPNTPLHLLINMSNDIKNSLSGIIGFLNLLKETPQDNSQLQYIENAAISARTLLNNMENIVDICMLETDRLTLETSKTDMPALLRQALEAIRAQAWNKNIEILYDQGPDMPRFADTDPVQLKKILISFLINAVKHTESGEIELKINFSPHDERKGIFNFSIRDTGLIIRQEKKKEIISVLNENDELNNSRSDYTKLGLILANHILRKMGSRINFSSEPDRGTTYFFQLETEYDYGRSHKKNRLKNLKKILLIDDNDESIRIIKEMLAGWEIDCISCNGGYHAIKLIEASEPFDAVLIDYDMPVLNGIETVKVIRKDLKIPAGKLPVVLLHNLCDTGPIEAECKKLDIYQNIQKPVMPDGLFHALKNIISTETDKKGNMDTKEGLLKKTRQGGPVILIAEYFNINMLLLVELISNIYPDACILKASNGIEAIEIFERESPDLILMNVQMPVMSGIEAAKAIREKENHSDDHTPIIALSTEKRESEKIICSNAGMDWFLSVPVSNGQLEQILKKIKIL